MSFDEGKWLNPELKYRAKPIIHEWIDDYKIEIEAIKKFGYGGVVTNPSHKNWYDGYFDNIKKFKDILEELKRNNLAYWLYDENGYPSGQAGGEVIKRHPEYAAKGFYMRRFATFEDTVVNYRLEYDSDKIIWAAKYPMDTHYLADCFPCFDKMIPVHFSKRTCKTSLEANHVLYVFAVRDAYYGSHSAHNISSRNKYINVLDKRAIKSFIDLSLEPILKEIPDAFKNAEAVFTDEPSLQCGYHVTYESWPYALMPWVDDLFEKYFDEYHESILPSLPLLFEGDELGYPIRTKFESLIGKIIANSYTIQLKKWCEKHGCMFSGHYISEEMLADGVKSYGSYLEVLKSTSYPGLDILNCYPEVFEYNTVKNPQTAARKLQKGLMVELCPFFNKEEFDKNPIENMRAMVGVLFSNGVRKVNSYFLPNFEEYSNALSGFKGYLDQEEANKFNNYVGRLGYMLDGLENKTGIFVYYALEEAQAKCIPWPLGFRGPESKVDFFMKDFIKTIMEKGHDFYYSDKEDLENALKSKNPAISNNMVKVIIVPPIDVMDFSSFESLKALEKKGVKVIFIDKIPKYATNGKILEGDFQAWKQEKVVRYLDRIDNDFTTNKKNKIIKSMYLKDGKRLYLLTNINRFDINITINNDFTDGNIYNLENGEIQRLRDKEVHIKNMSSIFIEI